MTKSIVKSVWMSLNWANLPAVLLKTTMLCVSQCETHKTNHKLTCDDSCFIYRFSFKPKLRTFCEERYVQRCLFNYFNSMGNNDFLKHIPITLFIITDGKAPKKKTGYWRRNFKTCSPFGLDAEDSASPFSYSSKWNI